MNLIEWNASYITGIDLIDSQHKILINKANKLNNCIQEFNFSNNLKILLDELLEYAFYHFEIEEEQSFVLKKKWSGENFFFLFLFSPLFLLLFWKKGSISKTFEIVNQNSSWARFPHSNNNRPAWLKCFLFETVKLMFKISSGMAEKIECNRKNPKS